MSKRKEKLITLTHTEILGFAIQRVAEFAQKEENDAREFEESNPEFAKRLREASIWRPKLKILLQMYTFETGSDYGFDYDIDLG